MQEPSTKQRKKPMSRKIVFIIALIVAIISIGVSLSVIVKTAGVETNANEKDAQVTITSNGPDPSVVTVKKGQSVVWTNQDKDPHSLALSTANPPKEMEGFGSDEPIDNGETYSFTFDAVGTFTYQDPNSPEKFQGTIEVKE